MLKKIYDITIFQRPLLTLFFLLACLSFLTTQATKLQIDASSDTLLMEGDKDYAFTLEVAKKFHSPEFLVVAFQTKGELLHVNTLNQMRELINDLEKLKEVSSSTSILNAPLLISTDMSLKELIGNIPTLQKYPNMLEIAKKEFTNNPLYKGNLVSEDLSTTAIILELKEKTKIKELQKQLKKLQRGSKEYLHTLEKIQTLQKRDRVDNDKFIANVRLVLQKHDSMGRLFLGGVNMVSSDLIHFIKNDLMIYGSTLLALLVFVLWLIFRQIRWICIPIVICVASIIATTGLLGLFGWKVTVISSNFISLQLIITISIVLHLIVRYRELSSLHVHLTQKELIWKTIQSKASPSFFAILTTIVGFSSLVFSNILPVINLGWMMSAGIALSLLIAFILFPLMLLPLKPIKPYGHFEKNFALTKILAKTVHRYKYWIFTASIIVVIFSLSGAQRLIVENSFINYFKSSTEIYKGMKVIDEKLGGTTPLDVVVTFLETKDSSQETSQDDSFGFDEFDSFDDEFSSTKDENQYWFTKSKMQTISKIHSLLQSNPYIGSVQSFGSVLQIGKMLNNNKDLDNFQLALLYNELPQAFKKIILEPYINLENNQVRFATRILDSNENLRRNELLQNISHDLDELLDSKNVSVRLSNLMVLYNNMLQSLFSSQIMTLGIVLVLLGMMFWFIFRSLKVATIALISNIVPMGVIFGCMGWFNIPLDMMTITIAAISLGIGVDDTIHYIHRYKEELQVDQNYIQAMHRSHSSIGYAMYYTSFSIILGFSVLTLSNFVPTIYFGVLTVLVMSMALLGALLLLPALFISLKPFTTR